MNKFYSFTLFSSTPFSKFSRVKKIAFSTLLGSLFLAGSLQAQVDVTATGGTMMASYGTLSAAVAAINAGTHTGTITVDVMAGHTETLSARIDLTATGTMANPITIQKSGAGANPLLTAYTGTNTPTSAERDGMFSLSGSDWVTIDGIDLQDAPGNTDAITTMEYGYGLFKASDTDGCQNVTIKNCTITLNRVNNGAWTGNGHNGSIGITVNNCTATVNTSITVTAASGSHSNNKFYTNTIQNCNAGISFTGFAAASPFDLGDTNNDVGGTTAGTGNTIINFGGGAGATQPATGVFANNQWDFNCSRNTINNNNGSGVNHAQVLRGIFLNASSTSASANCNFNTITVKGGGTTHQVTAIENSFGSTPAGNSINIRNNTITGEYLTATSGVFYGIYNTATPAFLNIENNTISNTVYSDLALTGSGVNYLIYSTASNAGLTVNIKNNTVSNHSRFGTTGGTTIGIFNSSGTTGMMVNVKNNLVDNLSIDGAGTSSIMYGIQTSTGTVVVDSNEVSNLKVLKTTGTGAMYGIYNIGSPVDENFNYNEVHDLTHNGTGIVYGIYLNTITGTRTFSFNEIYNVSGGGTTIAGCNHLSSSPNIFRNKIYNIQSTSTGAPIVSGMILGSLGTTGVANIYNNLIGDIKAPNASSSSATAPTIRGLNITATTTSSMVNVSYNTVYLNASTSGANFATAALFVTTSTTSTTANLTLLNNILINNSTPSGTGNAVAFQRSSTALNNYNSASNNNLYYAGTPGANNLIFFDGTNADQTLDAFKNRVAPADAVSVSGNPTFLSLSGTSPNFLHIDPAVPTQVESGGVNVAGITTDFDGNIRQGNAGYTGMGTAPDIGADEGDFMGIDLTAPNISYTPIPGSCTTGNQTLTATITDATGVPTMGALQPRIYYRKGAGSWFSQQGTLASGTGTNGAWNFTIVAADMGGLAIGDMVSYYIIAQDLNAPPNIGSNPPGVMATDVNNVTTHPASPNTFNVLPTLSGTYTVGAGGAYTTLTDAVNAYNNSCVTGPVVFSLTDATYPSETFPISIGNAVGNSSTNTLTIRPAAGNTATISGSASSIIVLSGADWVIIDGSNSGGTDKNLTLENTSTATNSAVIYIQSQGAGAGATNDVIKNCIIQAGSNTTTSTFGIYSAGTTISTSGTGDDNDDILIQNNTIRKAYFGIYARATGPAGAHDNLQIIGNTIGDDDPTNYVINRGIQVQYVAAPVISENTIFNMKTTNSISIAAIELAAGVTDAQVTRNNISGIYSESTGGWGAYGVNISTTTGPPNNNLIANNFISDIRTVNYSSSSSTFNAFGIRLAGGTNTKIYNNSINLFGDITIVSGSPSVPVSACVLITTASATNVEIRNNILRNTQTFVSGTPKIYSVWAAGTGYSFAAIDNNDYYGTDGTGGNPTTYHVGRISATDYTTLAAWQAYTGSDANSTTVEPLFVSPTDLHLTATNNQCLDGAAAPLADVTIDYDGAARDAVTPDIGADEFTNPDLTLTIAETSGIAPNDGSICAGASADLTAAGGASYLWSNGANTPSTSVSPASTTTYTVTVTHANSCTDVLSTEITVNPAPTAYSMTGGGSYCAPGAGVPVGLSGSETGFDYQLKRNGVNVGAPVAGTGAALDFGNQTIGGDYTASATNAATACSADMTGVATVTVNPTPAAFSVTGGGAYCTPPGGGAPVGLSGSETGVDYQLLLNGSNAGAPVAGTGVALDFGNQTAVGTYTVVATANAGGCTADMTGSAVVSENVGVTFTEVHGGPTTCVATDGTINLTVTGGVGPFSFNWATQNGSGIVQGQEDQSTLTVGIYDVTVTGSNGCSATMQIALIGPGNCEACPVIGALAANPTGVCINETVALTTSGLVDMGDTYGITFKYSTTSLPDPYVGGTVIATIPNSGLGNNKTTATTSTSFPTGDNYFIYAILDVLPTNPDCRPSQQISLPVVNIPSVDPVASQTLCNGSATAPVSFTGPVPGTIFNWTNNNPSIGLAASGAGDIPSFNGVNNGTAPAVALITVTPVTASTTGAMCTGPSITFTITVNPTPTVNAVTSQTVCRNSSTAAVTFSGAVPGTVYNWTNDNTSIGLAASGTGNIAAFVGQNPGTAPISGTITVTPSYTNNGVTCTGTPTSFTITVNPTPTVTAVPGQVLCNGAATTAVTFSGTVPGTTFNWTNSAPSIGLAASGSGNIPSFTAVNTGGAPVVATITVTPVFSNNGVNCSGSTIVFTYTVNPTAQVNQPANVVTCGGAPTSVTFTTTTPGSTFSWTNSNPAIGLAASGTGNISFTAATVLVQTVATITVTPNYTNAGVSCPGTPRTFTITVNPLPTVNPVGNQTNCSGEATVAVTFTGSLPGTVFEWTNNNASIGLAASGTGNINSFITQNTTPNIQVATITVTPVFNVTGGSCPGTPITFTYTVYPRPLVNVGPDIAICENQVANLTAQLGGGATGGTWSGGAGTFGNPNAAVTTYTPAVSEYGTTITLTFTSNDPAGPCPAVSDALQCTINTLPLVYAGEDLNICEGATLNLSVLGATITDNGSGVTTGTWTTSGTGTFQPSNAFPPGATTYVPSAADYAAGFVTLTLTSADPAGPCMSVNDKVRLGFKKPGPVICNDNVQVSLDETGTAVINADMVLEGTYLDEFYNVSILVNGVSIGNTVNCTHVGKTLQVRVTDICTNNFCWGTIKVEDKLKPELTCSNINIICAITNYSPAYLQNTLGLQTAYPTVEENCPPATLSYVDDFIDLECTDPYSARIRRTWTAVDGSGNTGSCLQNIYLDRRHVTDVQFPADVTISCNSGNVNTTPSATGAPYLVAFGQNWPLSPTAGQCELQTAYVDQVLPVCDGTYKILRTWTVYDWCLPTSPNPPNQNPVYFIQVIKVTDSEGPTLACPANLTVSTDPFTCCGSPNLPDIIVEDACSRIDSANARIVVRDPVTNQVTATYDLKGTLQDFSGNNHWAPDTLAVFGATPCLPLGAHTVTYKMTDNCGNTSTCTFRLTIDDGTPPVVACDEFTQVSLGISGEVFVNATTFDDGSYDNCSQVYFKARRMNSNSCQSSGQFHDQVKFCCDDINDTITVVLRVYDVEIQAGSVSTTFQEQNANDCMVQVFVDDKLKPTCIPPANVTVSCENFDPSLWAYGFATSNDNCCVDTITVTNNYTLFDTLCSKGTITRTFRAFDCGGLSTTCTQRVFVNYEQDYFVRFPNDVIVTVCDGTGNYGEPTFFGKDCELLGVSFEDEVFTVVPDACYKIERTWTIINWCTYDPNQGCTIVPNPNPNATSNHPSNLPGPIVSAAGTPAPWNPTVVAILPGQSPTNYSTFWSANANCYKYKQIIKVIDTQKPIVTDCPTSPVEVCDLTANNNQLWNEMYWYDNTHGTHDLCEGPTDLTITATDLCSGSNINIRYLLFLDLDGDGVMETVISSTNLPGFNNVQYNNAANPNFAGGTSRAFDERPVPFNQKYGFALQTTVSGANKTASVRWNTQQQPSNYTIPELPYGKHKIKWIVEDGCGNEQVCEYEFEVKDCKKPTVVCINGLSVNIMPTQMISLWAADFLQYTEDNCTPASQLVIAIRKSGTGSGFPLNPDGTPQTSVTFTCNELGTQLVELWSRDQAGNADYCETYVIVQDNMANCSNDAGTVAGTLKTEANNGLEGANIELNGSHPALPPVSMFQASNQDGNYLFPGVPFLGNYTITPVKDNDPLNGVSTFDLVLINKHILGLEPLTTPYKMIAADANNSRSITTFDIVELRKLILGIYTELPNNTSWRFVDKGFAFPDPVNPFQTVFPETIQITQVGAQNGDFVAVKVGDVNGNAVTSSLMSSEERTAGTLLFDTDDRAVKAGEVFTVNFRAAEKVKGYQFTLLYPGLEVVEVQPGAEMTLGNFGIFNDRQSLTTSFDKDGVQGEFAVTFRAQKGGQLSELLKVSSQITRAEAYSENDVPASAEASAGKMTIALRFNGATNTIVGQGFELYQNTPNPWISRTQIGFFLPTATEATLRVFDETGRQVYTQSGDFSAGYNAFTLERAVLNTTGALFYKVETATDSAVRTMIQTK